MAWRSPVPGCYQGTAAGQRNDAVPFRSLFPVSCSLFPPYLTPSTTSSTNFDPKNASTSSPIATNVQRTAVGPRQP